ncbi:stealth family protein [Vibrio owensii]|uniref:stealth family protein n=1 Tax=Vibrio owensii TaxID=696485 RepID=UPI0018F1F5CE|nr:stealth family protein [Vibrio owensii]
MSKIKIDFVIPWVNGSDPEWQDEFKNHSPNPDSCDARFERYRDWDLLKYWFRGVEKNAPWVNKIYFITWGHVPAWLNLNHPKLVVVKHEDYIPAEYLPTFSSHPIELNMHRIRGLSERFVYFNDDFFLINKVRPEHFFVNKLPCDMASLFDITSPDKVFERVLKNNNDIINSHFDKRKVIDVNLSKWFNFNFGFNNFKTISRLKNTKDCGIAFHHLPQSFLKSTLLDVWDNYHEIMDSTSRSKFRSVEDVNQYIFKQWQICKGEFSPKNPKSFGIYVGIRDKTLLLANIILRSKFKSVVCLNDVDGLTDFYAAKELITNTFNKILPNESSFEVGIND